MHRYAVDPVVVTLPSQADGDPAEWLRALTAWLFAVADEPEFEWIHFAGSTEILVEKGRYPDFVSLRDLIDKHDIDIDAGWVVRHLSRFFQDPARAVAAQCTVKCALSEDAPAVTPEQFLTRNPLVAARLVDDLVVLGCEWKWLRVSTAIVSLPFTNTEAKVAVSASIAMTDPANIRPAGEDVSISVEFPVVFSPADLTSVIEPRRLFSIGPRAVRLEIMRRAGARAQHVLEIGNGFLASVWDSGIVTDTTAAIKLLRAAAALVSGTAIGGFDVHAIRANASGNAPQVVRSTDGAKAWRLTLTKHGAGWRLQYWHVFRGGREVFELANVVVEQEVEMPE